VLIIALLALATVLFRLPVLINARDVNSDAALVGLQAMHMLRGEWSWLLWGVGYQSSLDSVLTAGAFALFGSSPVVLMLVPILLHAVIVLVTFSILRRRLDLLPAALCTLPLVLAPVALSWPILSANRQACIVLVFITIWLLDGAAESKRPLPRFGIGALLTALVTVVDLYAVLFVPALVALAVMSLLDGAPQRRIVTRRAVAGAIGLALGATIFLVSRSNEQSTTGQAGLTAASVDSNASLLWDQCLPYALGHAQYHEGGLRYRGTVAPPTMPWAVLHTAGGWSILLGVFAGGLLGLSKLPWPLRRLGLFGLLTTLSTFAAFLFSVMPADLWSVRYLGPIFWTAPFALAPLARWLGVRRFVFALAPWLIVSSISGWQSYQTTFTHAERLEEQQLIEHLRAHDIRYAAADYWLAYRLTFIAREDPVVVPIDPLEDRYEPYRQQFLKAPAAALIFHARWSRVGPEAVERWLRAESAELQEQRVGEFVVLRVQRRI
jgi:hypothetical protein